MSKKAETLSQIHNTFKLSPIEKEDLGDYYVENSHVRSYENIRKDIAETLKNSHGSNEQILFTGYRGCGKSTELNYLEKELEDHLLALNFSIQKELNALHLNYIEIFILLMEKLFKHAKDNDLKISNTYIELIKQWAGTREIKEINDKYIGIDIQAGAEGSAGIPGIFKFFTKLRANAKNSRSLKEVLTVNIEPRLSELIDLCNDLIAEIKKCNKSDILIIIEDIDKIPFADAKELFFNYISVLTDLKTNIIYTFPFALYHNPQFNTISSYFDMRMVLPMIKVKQRDNNENAEGIAVMQEMVSRRMDLSLFESRDLLNELILMSGGVIRDLFRMIKDAARSAADEKITKRDITNAINYLKRDYANNIGDIDFDGQKYSADSFYKALVTLVRNPAKSIDNTNEELLLLQNLSILGYNGENWYDVHPVIRRILEERKKL